MAEIWIAVSLGGWANDDTDATPDLIEIAVPIPDGAQITDYEYRALFDTVATNTVSLVDAVRKPVEPVVDAEVVNEPARELVPANDNPWETEKAA
jgi:hypothetical protein